MILLGCTVCLGIHGLTQSLHEYKLGLGYLDVICCIYSLAFLPESSQLEETSNYSFIATKAAHPTMTILKGDHGCLWKNCLHCLSFKLFQRALRRFARIQKSVKPQKCVLSISKN